MIWKYLKPWVDPRTAEKIVVLNSTEVLPTLEEFIPHANIPTVFGGKFQFKHGAVPEIDDGIWQHFSWNLTKQSLPAGPIKWIKDPDGSIVALAVGTEGESQRKKRIATLSLEGQ